MSKLHQRDYAYGSLVVLAVAFVAAVIASNSLLRGFKLDLTENNLYTLAPGTRNLLAELNEPINLYYFFSNQNTGDVQELRSYAARVEEMLEEFAVAASGKLRLQTIDPLPFSEDEDRAAQFGLTDLGLSILGGNSLYFGLAATNAIGDEAVIEVFDPAREASLEYDLARLVYSLSTPDKPVIGLLSGAPITGGFDPQTQQIQNPWVMYQQVRQLFDVRNLASDLATVDDDISLLWIVHPTDLSENALYAIDQFILRGGRALIFVDPLAEVASQTPDPTGLGEAASSSLDRLFDAWGIVYDPTEVVADNLLALSVNIGARPVRHIGLLGLQDEALAEDELITAGLDNGVNVGTVGSLAVADDAEISLVPLLRSSEDSTLLPATQFQFLADPLSLLDSFVADGESHIIGARIEGPLNSAFADGPPAGTIADAGEHVAATANSNLIVVADVDILSDRMWVQRQRGLLGGEVLSAFANNGDFVANAVANLAGSENLIGLKSRQTYVRPFDLVERLRRDADARFRETEQQLQAELAETERRLAELQQSREDQTSIFMSPEQEQELERFQDEQLRIRRELRSVRLELNSSIENLGTWLKLINILLFPLGLAVIAFAAYLVRRRRQGAPT